MPHSTDQLVKTPLKTGELPTPSSQSLSSQMPPAQTILLAVTGMSPAVLTETVWALAFPDDPSLAPIIPDRVIVLTTIPGRDAIRSQLFGEDAIWSQLREAVLGPKHREDTRLFFGPVGECIRLFTRNVGGEPMELTEVSDLESSTAVADCLTDEIWGHVGKPGTRLIASISGGFKTMSALLFASMSLLGRRDDLITHVLVNAPFDTALKPRFFFPAQLHQELLDSEKKVWQAKTAKVRLGLVPFVPLHNLLEKYQKPRSTIESANNSALPMNAVVTVTEQWNIPSPTSNVNTIICMFRFTHALSHDTRVISPSTHTVKAGCCI